MFWLAVSLFTLALTACPGDPPVTETSPDMLTDSTIDSAAGDSATGDSATADSTTDIANGDVITSSLGDAVGVVASFVADTSITLEDNWDGVTDTGQAEEVIIADDYAIRGKTIVVNSLYGSNVRIEFL